MKFKIGDRIIIKRCDSFFRIRDELVGATGIIINNESESYKIKFDKSSLNNNHLTGTRRNSRLIFKCFVKKIDDFDQLIPM